MRPPRRLMTDSLKKSRNAEEEYTNIPVGSRFKQEKAKELIRLKNQVERALSTMEQHWDTICSTQSRLHEVGLMGPPSPTSSDASGEEELSDDDSNTMQVDEPEDEELGGASREEPPPEELAPEEQQAVGSDPPAAVEVTGPKAPTDEDDQILDRDTTIAPGEESPTAKLLETMERVTMESPSTEHREEGPTAQ